MELHSWFKIIKIINNNKIEIEDQIGEKYILYVHTQENPKQYKLNEFILMYIIFTQMPDNSFRGIITKIVGDKI